ncbi:Fe(3+) dicitrate ABC transporter ATP-binding protein FecE [Vibrio cincinnatiensis]|jgi:iron complex transport system ATP-binding protein|uniref:Iron complex transport system ATP-binding protein n=1 Tax=Vibrio cincinnatiensis DSM 19608 TaxID=1123491 RepID=A0A1T4NSK0_VIBCI|nr:Fe(3+) dicitrate ABC transporter ATP-binding protein FecE [Vibrio cincinnatiensis]MCG3724865.1 Fe(3+) dicitrate ABC transporter ATP-binding protein FecE [Vibrio cincinnatiensis]MCG3747503.1 Fe(3+) dicitrate ABC transporter ATP-binding protein FecE [Vibrio cincinnatiensis]SJZ82036.1 iron complex transport system ATP-binding protein [Vibrio cincinnatiensis DSM 19608]SUP05437.1 ATP-binding component of citrate-dependent iron(III) transport protein [Vibrio cincinnatiensis]
MRLTTENLVVGYGKGPIVNDVDVTIPEGKITALLGPNGCGKSTLLKTLSRILKPQSGQVFWEGKAVQKVPSRVFAQQLALLPQSQQPPEGVSVQEVVSYGRSPYTGFWGQLSVQDKRIVEQAMKATGVETFADKPVMDLSGGQRQRVWLALTLAQDTDFILLDEPTTYLDMNHQVELMKLLRMLNQQGKTIVTVLHDINQACRYCDHLIVMQAGRVISEGSPQIVMTPKLLAEVFELDAEIHQDPIAGTPMCIVR